MMNISVTGIGNLLCLKTRNGPVAILFQADLSLLQEASSPLGQVAGYEPLVQVSVERNRPIENIHT